MNEAHYTPIGPVSQSFPYFADLMSRAKFGYEDSLEHGTVTRRWFIVADSERVPATKKRTTGKTYKDERDMRIATNEHRKFCMIRDAVNFLCRGLANTEQVLSAALQKIAEVRTSAGTVVQVASRVDELWSLPWKQCENAVTRMGVPGWENRRDSDDLPSM